MIFSAALHAACLAVVRSSLLHIPSYALISIAGILAALWLSLHTARLRGLSSDALWDAGFFAVIAAFVISRLMGFLLLLAIEHGHLTLSFRDVLRFSSISYLSLLVTAIVVALWLRRKKLPLLRVIRCVGAVRCAALVRALTGRRSRGHRQWCTDQRAMGDSHISRRPRASRCALLGSSRPCALRGPVRHAQACAHSGPCRSHRTHRGWSRRLSAGYASRSGAAARTQPARHLAVARASRYRCWWLLIRVCSTRP